MTCHSRKRVGCIGDFSNKITIFDRNIVTPTFTTTENVDADESFTNGRIKYANIKPFKRNVSLFDDVNTVQSLTHEMFIRYDETITSENWIEYRGSRYDIMSVENVDQGFEFLSLKCILRGLVTKEATKA